MRSERARDGKKRSEDAWGRGRGELEKRDEIKRTVVSARGKKDKKAGENVGGG